MLWCVCVLMVLAACSPMGEVAPALQTENAALGTAAAESRLSATVAADQLRQTAEYLQTEIPAEQVRGQVLAQTLSAAGIDPSQVTAGAIVPTPFIAPPLGATRVMDLNVTADAPTPTPSDLPTLYTIIVTNGVGENDCPLQAVSSFSTQEDRLYVAATADHIRAGMTINAHWYRGLEEVVQQWYKPDFDISQQCIWFYIEPNDVRFTPDNWSVALDIDGVMQGNPIPFTIISE